MRRARQTATLALSLLVGACTLAPPSAGERLASANAIAQKRGWVETQLDTWPFALASWGPPSDSAESLWIYIEGDGLAYLNAERISDDPTPTEPLALELAAAQPNEVAVYLARPCQYLSQQKDCSRAYWTQKRSAPEVLDAMNEAVDRLKAHYHTRRLTLVGYSGGGTLAALLAARRTDVERLVTVAGNLSIKAWADTKHLTQLSGSLDPADVRDRLITLDQWHFVGTSDDVVPLTLTESFVAGMPHAHLFREERFDHRCCWVNAWPRLWESIR